MDLPAADDVLAQPTRARLFSIAQELRRPASTGELADRAGMHVNGVRRHLEALADAGLVERLRVPRGRGRPRDEWRIAAAANPAGERPRAYGDLARWLARATPSRPRRLREIERAGREIGRDLVPAGAESSAEGFRGILATLGFQPELEIDDDGTTRCRLCNCPYRDAVRENPEVVCTMHRGLTAGILDQLAPGARLASFEPRDPDRAGCVAAVNASGWAAASPAD